jgi:hypothetical protein
MTFELSTFDGADQYVTAPAAIGVAAVKTAAAVARRKLTMPARAILLRRIALNPV